MGREVLKKFDRYFLLDCIAQGGMAEIFRARLASEDGASRLLVIKRILAGHGKNEEFQSMFKSEIKVMMGFNHPNIVQLYDFGDVEKKPYIAMEFVDGKNLRHFINRFTKQGKRFPIDLATYVIEQAAAGLNYAHTFKDKISGESLKIVHRDVSPQNILISFDGNVKVIDFGIAKAKTNVESTRVGIIKGKPSYLSPEQITGETLDARSDLFSLGTVLWEVLTGKKLFTASKGENEFAVLKLIESCDAHVRPPSRLNPDVPKDLDYIVLKCLAKSRDKRFQTVEELQRALHRFLYANFPDFNPADLSYHAKSLFKDHIVEDRKLLQTLNGKAEQLLEKEVSKIVATENSGDKAMISREKSKTFSDQNRKPKRKPEEKKRRIDDIKSVANAQKVEMRTHEFDRQKTDREVKKNTSVTRSRSSQMPMKSVRNVEDVSGSYSNIPRKRGSISQPQITAEKRSNRSGSVFALLCLAAGLAFYFIYPDIAEVIQTPDTPVVQPDEPKRTPDNVATENSLILLKLDISKGFGNTEISVNNTKIESESPEVKVPLGEPLELIVLRPKYKPFRREFVLDPIELANANSYTMRVNLEPKKVGILNVSSTPSADVVIKSAEGGAEGSKPWQLRTPVEGQRLPAGVYQIHLENKVLGMEKDIVVEIKEGQQVSRDEQLEIQSDN